MYKIYLAHPISGQSADDVFNYYEHWIHVFAELGAEILCPMIAKGYLRTEMKFKAHGYGQPISTNRAIVGRDSWMVQQADIVLIDFIGADIVSIGCVSELAWAWQHKKHTIVTMGEDNIHQHAFVIQMADIILPDMVAAQLYLRKLLNREF